MTLLTDKMSVFNQPSLDKVERDLRVKGQLSKVFERTTTAPETIPDMKDAMKQIRQNDTTFSQSFLSGTGSRKVN